MRKNARPIAYGGMLIECALAIVSLCAVGYIWSRYADGTTVVPTAVFATGISEMVATIPGLGGSTHVLYSLLVLTVSVFCLTSLDTATRLARYMFQEFWLEPGQTYKEATGYKAVLTNPVVSTVITVVLGIGLGLTGYSKIWPLFGASNQLLAAIGLLAVATWLGKSRQKQQNVPVPDGIHADRNHHIPCTDPDRKLQGPWRRRWHRLVRSTYRAGRPACHPGADPGCRWIQDFWQIRKKQNNV